MEGNLDHRTCTPWVNSGRNKFECRRDTSRLDAGCFPPTGTHLWRPFEQGALALLMADPRREAYHPKLQRAMTGKTPTRTVATSVGRSESMKLFPPHSAASVHAWISKTGTRN